MMKKAAFQLSELTEDFFKRVCYIEQMWSSGMGGPGHIIMITETGGEYFLGIEGYDEYNPQYTVPLLEVYKEWNEEKHRNIYCIEKEGWTFCEDFAAIFLIRNDLYEKVNKLYYDTEHRELKNEDCYKLVKCVLKPEGRLARKVFEKTQEAWEQEELERRKAEEAREKVRLTEEDIEWKPLHANNLLSNPIEGTYAFLFKREENGQISGYKWTIVFQRKEITHGRTYKGAPIEAYNLFFNEYSNVIGVLGYRESGYDWRPYDRKSTIQDGVHDYGRFVRSYKTLELAKESVRYRNEWIGWGNVNKENIIRVSTDEQSVAEMERSYDAWMKDKEKESNTEK